MKYKCLTLSVIVICFLGVFAQTINAKGKKSGQINWVNGYIDAIGEGTATPSGNKLKDEDNVKASRTHCPLRKNGGCGHLYDLEPLTVDSKSA